MTAKTDKKRMGVSPLNFGLLESTLEQKHNQPEHPVETPEKLSEEETKLEAGHDMHQVPKGPQKAEKVARIPATVKKVSETSDSKKKMNKRGGEGEDIVSLEQDNPFGYNMVPNWPLVNFDKPFLIQVPEMQAKAGSAISIRIPYDLNLTMEKHCISLGVTNVSKWLREAIERQLSVEQQHLSKKKRNAE